jgi:hypothetical protein
MGPRFREGDDEWKHLWSVAKVLQGGREFTDDPEGESMGKGRLDGRESPTPCMSEWR